MPSLVCQVQVTDANKSRCLIARQRVGSSSLIIYVPESCIRTRTEVQIPSTLLIEFRSERVMVLLLASPGLATRWGFMRTSR